LPVEGGEIVAEGNARILVVDDQPLVAQTCAEILAGEGYQVQAAYGGQEALGRLEKEQFDLLLADLKMPGVDGLAVLRRARELHPGLASVMITSYATLENAIAALRSGAQDFLLKPFDPDDLVRSVGEALAAAGREATLQALRRREQQLSSIYDNASDVLFYLAVEADDRFRFVTVNRAFLQATGLAEEQIIGKDFRQVIPEAVHDLVLGKYQEAIRERRTATWEEISVYPAGKKVGEVSVTPVFDAAGHCTHLVGVVHDVTGQCNAQERIRASEERYRALFENSMDAILLTSPDGSIQAANPAACRMLGRTEAEILQAGRAGVVDPSDPRLSKLLAERARTGQARGELTMLRRDGTPFPAEVSSAILQDSDGTSWTSMIIRDISERKRAEEALHASEERFRLISMVSSDYMFSSQPGADGELILDWVAGAFEEITGYTFDEYVAHGGWRATLHPDDLAVDDRDLETLRSNRPVITEVRTFTKGGNLVWNRVYAHPVWDAARQELVGVYGAVQDITERKQAEEMLRQKTEDLALINVLNHAVNQGYDSRTVIELLCRETKRIFSCSGATVYLLDEDKKHLIVQNAALPQSIANHIEKLAGIQIAGLRIPLKSASWYDQALLAGKPQMTNDPAVIQKMMSDCTTSKTLKKLVPRIYRFLDYRSVMSIPLMADGEAIGLLDISRREPFTDSDLMRFEILAVQLTTVLKHMQTEDELERLDRQKELILNAAGEGIYGLDLQRNITFVNPVAANMLGWEKEEIVGRLHHEVMHHSWPDGSPYPRDKCQIYATLEDGSIHHVTDEVFWRKDGTSFPVEYVSSPILEGRAVVGAVVTFKDVTERVNAQQALRESEQRLKEAQAMGRLGNWEFDLDRQSIVWSNQVYELYERDPAFGPPTPKEEAAYYSPEQAHILREYARRAMETGEGFEYDLEARLPSGKIAYFSASMHPTRDEHGRVVKLRGTVQDITERKRAEEALAAERLLLRTLIDHLPDAIYVKDGSGRKTLANPADVRNMGASSEAEVLGKTDFDFYPRDLAVAFHADDQNVIQSGQPVLHHEEMITLPDGTRGWQMTSKVPLRDNAGQVVGLVGIGRDITQRKRAEEALREERDRAQTYLDMAGVMFVVINADENVSLLNRRGCQILGYKEEEIAGKNWFDTCIPARLRDQVRAVFDQLMASQVEVAEYYENPVVTREGKERIIAWHNTLLRDTTGKTIGTLSSGEDITERKQAEEEIQQAERRYRNLFEDAPVMYVITRNQEGMPVVADCNTLFLSRLGYNREQVLGRPLADFYTPQSQAELLPGGGYQRALEGSFTVEERQLVTRDGQVIDTLLHASPESDAAGRVWGTRAAFVDITPRKRAEAELRRLKEFNEGIIHNMAEGILVEDAGGTITFANPAAATMLGYPPEGLVGQPWTSIVPPDQQPIVQAANERRVRSQTDHYEVELVRQDGARRPVLVSAGPHLGGDTGVFAGTLAVFTDLSELKRLEEQFRQAQKMEAIGRLAGGVAHDFNNLLTVIHLSTRLLEKKLHREDPLWQHVQRIQDASQRATNLTKQLLAFSRREIVEPKVLDLNQVVGELDKMLRRLIGEDIELATLLAGDLWPVKIDPTQIEQVVINLAVNARDAMPTGGKLTIETANVVLDAAYAVHHLEVEPGEYVLLAVSDTGTGMSDEVKARIFEPFFTTKEKGKGTGLGLATVFGIVKQNEGNIWVYSEPGRGTTFKIYLPKGKAEPEAKIKDELSISTSTLPLPSTSTLLVVEDETEVRELVRDILLAQGYRVLAAQDGMEALQVAQEHEGPIHLLITDVVMPRLSGKALADELRSSRPQMGVLYTSGYTDNAIVHHGVLDEGVHFLSKPFELEALARKVREVLERHSLT
jgi:two-component system cell cycle sensor histidine kinase/response regulator CckA